MLSGFLPVIRPVARGIRIGAMAALVLVDMALRNQVARLKPAPIFSETPPA